jgi:hypothetical protein
MGAEIHDGTHGGSLQRTKGELSADRMLSDRSENVIVRKLPSNRNGFLFVCAHELNDNDIA